MGYIGRKLQNILFSGGALEYSQNNGQSQQEQPHVCVSAVRQDARMRLGTFPDQRLPACVHRSSRYDDRDRNGQGARKRQAHTHMSFDGSEFQLSERRKSVGRQAWQKGKNKGHKAVRIEWRCPQRRTDPSENYVRLGSHTPSTPLICGKSAGEEKTASVRGSFHKKAGR